MQRYYPHIAAVAGVLILLLILWGPSDGEDSARDSIVWKEDWQVIEYYASADAPHPTLRLIREPGLVSDSYFTESPAAVLAANDTATDAAIEGVTEDDGQSADAKPEYVRRRGGPSVTNTFRDWRRPKLNAYHRLSPEREAEFGLNEPEHVVRFYERPGGTPVELRAGVKSGGANRFVASTYYDHEDLLLIIGSYLFDKFTQSPFSYREKRILYYPTASFTREIRVTNKDGETLRLNAAQEPREQGAPLTIYRRYNPADDSSTDIPNNIASPLDAAVKSMMIHRFRDEAAEIGDAEALWEQAGKDFAEVKVDIAKGDSYWMRFRQAPGIEATDEDLILIQSSVSIGTDWARRTAVENALRNMQIISGYVPPEPQPETEASANDDGASGNQ
ncbi:MAG: DUF4340 domain-containing protein [bacterium]|nr:DUF4340 domain-containing protein [bacterium]